MSGAVIPTERQVQRQILDMMGRCFPECFVTHIPNGAHLAGNDQARFKQVGALKGDGMKVGMPDLLVLWPVERGAFIEVKRPKGGKLSDNQFEVHAKLLSLGWRVATVKSVEEAYRFLNDCGAPCRGRLIGIAA
jgi:hypothetical protein